MVLVSVSLVVAVTSVEESVDGRFPEWIDKSRAAKDGMDESKSHNTEEDTLSLDLGASHDVREAMSLGSCRCRLLLLLLGGGWLCPRRGSCCSLLWLLDPGPPLMDARRRDPLPLPPLLPWWL